VHGTNTIMIVLSNSVSQSITLAVQTTAYVCNHLIAGNVGLITGGCMYVCIVCLLCAV